jgi:paraquat-inducible protein A
VARCTRCGNKLYDRKRHALHRALALTLTSLILFVVANAYPFMSFQREGIEQVTTLAGGVHALSTTGMPGLALLVGFVALLAPLVQMSGLLWVLLPTACGRKPWQRERSVRILELLRPWAMVEILMLGALVAFVKLQDYAKVETGFAFWAFAALVLTMAAAAAHVDPEDLFEAEELDA